jgi:hypothetical protein
MQTKMKITTQDYIDKMEKQYNGYSFDVISHVYNPYSTLSCLRENEFSTFWFSTATPTFLMKYFANRNLHIGDFIEYTISKNEIRNSIEIEHAPPALMLYQAGYLTLEKKPDELEYILNYPNFEIFLSIGAILSDNIFSKSADTNDNLQSIASAMKNRDIQGILHAIDFAIDSCGYDTFDEIKKMKSVKRESFFRDMIALFMMGTYTITVLKEVFGSRGRSDIVASYANRTYVFELTIAYPGDNPETKLAEARAQIMERKYYKQHFFSVDTVTTVAMVIDNEQRKVTHHDVVDLHKNEILASEKVGTPSIE